MQQYTTYSSQRSATISPIGLAVPTLTRLPVTTYLPRTNASLIRLPTSRQGIPGVPLVDAAAGRLDELNGANEKYFGAGRDKMRFTVLVPGYEPFYQAKNIYTVKNGQTLPISFSKVVQLAGQVLDKFVTKASSTLVQGDVPRFGLAPGEPRREDLYILQLDVYGSTTQIIVAYIERALPSRAAQVAAVPSSSLPSVTHASYGLPASAGQAQYSPSVASQTFSVPQPQARTAWPNGPYATTSSPERQNLRGIYTQPTPATYPSGWPAHHASTASASFAQSNQSVRGSVSAGQHGPAPSFAVAGQSGGGRPGPAASGTGDIIVPNGPLPATVTNGSFLATATPGASAAAAQQLAYNSVYHR